MKNKPDADFFIQTLDTTYPDEFCHLDWDRDRPWTLLFAVIMSAQCTDERVNIVTKKLFKIGNFGDLPAYVAKPVEMLEQEIYSTGFYRAKAKNLKKCAEQLLIDHDGRVPNNMADLIKLAGVGRKTANVILWNICGKNEGFVVDTHVGRITRRFGFTTNTNPVIVERDLMAIFPQAKWGEMSHQLVQFGRDFCQSRSPKCSQCPLRSKCISAKVRS